MRLSVPDKVVVAANLVEAVPDADDAGQYYSWSLLRADIRNMSVTVNHHFEYQ